MTVVWSPLMLISLKRLFFEAPTNDYHHLLFIECHGVNNCRRRVHLQEAVGKHTACALQRGLPCVPAGQQVIPQPPTSTSHMIPISSPFPTYTRGDAGAFKGRYVCVCVCVLGMGDVGDSPSYVSNLFLSRGSHGFKSQRKKKTPLK